MRSNCFRTIIVFALAALSVPAGAGERRVMRFLSFQNDGQWWFVASAPEGGPAVKFMMTEEVRKTAKDPTPGSRLVWVTTRPGAAGLEVVTEVAPFDGPKELEAPTAYVFDGTAEEKVGVATTTVAKFSKFGNTRAVLLPSKPGLGGRAAPDPAMLEKLKSFDAGDVVEIDVQGKGNTLTLIDIDKYRPTKIAEFMKAAQVTVNGKNVPGVTLAIDDTQTQYALPSTGPKGAALGAVVRKLRPGMYVRFTARDEAKPPVLRDIRPDVEVRPTTAGHLDIIATFCRVNLSSYSASTYCYVYPESNRPEDKALIAGCRRLTYDLREQVKAGLSTIEAERMKAILDPPRNNTEEDQKLTPRERAEYAQLYRAWLQTNSEAERARVEEQMLAGAIELSQRFRKEADFQIVTVKGMLSPDQLKAAKKLGEDMLSRRAE